VPFVGLDFGGTAIKGGAVDAHGEIIAERAIPSALEHGAETVMDRAAELARSLGASESGALGVGCAGIFDRERGVLLESPNLSQLAGTCLTGELAKRLGLDPARVLLENDANVAAYGEQWRGAARDLADFMILTLGTGVGGGLVLDGRLFTGPTGKAGEIGHVVIEPDGPLCGCGAHGCLETLGSATAARRRAKERGLPVEDPGNLELLADTARSREGAERELLFDIGRDLGHGIAYPANLLDLSCFVFAGGFAATLDLLEPGIRAGASERTFGERELTILPATLGGSAGWIGAARLVRDAGASPVG
jgi:glucokinase